MFGISLWVEIEHDLSEEQYKPIKFAFQCIFPLQRKYSSMPSQCVFCPKTKQSGDPFMFKYGLKVEEDFSSFKMQIGQTYPFCWKVPINDANNPIKQLGLFFGTSELSMLSIFSAWLNLNYHFSLRFYSEGDSGSHWYRAVSMKQL